MTSDMKIAMGAKSRDESMASGAENANALLFRRRMLQWPNPVEYVNNMYGSHPGEDDMEYFRTVFKR